MTPAARLSAAADILDTLDYSRLVDPQLKGWARRNRFAGSGDRRAIADRVYTCLRMRRSCSVLGNGTSGRALVLGSLVTDESFSIDEIAVLCTGGYGLEALTDKERSSLQTSLPPVSDAERLDWPDWLIEQARSVFGERTGKELNALRYRAPLDVRVNTLKTTIKNAQNALEGEGFEVQAVPLCETALRLPFSTRIVGTAAWHDGLIEPQDAASQAVALFSKAKPGEKVLDYCAGAGGKTVALAAMMQNQGVLLAHDVDAKRMTDLLDRAKKCGATVIRLKTQAQISESACDTVLVDAPCSGSGSWRRDPLGKWRLTPERLDALHMSQREALENAARFVKVGGLLTYATCSILPSENREQVAWFAEQHPEFVLEDTLNLWPARDDCDGFFAARFRRIEK